MSQSLSAVLVHGIFSTKNRQPFLSDVVLQTELYGVLGAVSNHLGCKCFWVGGADDHVHILSMLGRGVTRSDWVKEVKRRSSVWVKEREPALRDFAWQSGFGVFSVDPTRLDQVCRYIETQADHHRRWSFQDEFRKILVEYNVEFDERYVWS